MRILHKIGLFILVFAMTALMALFIALGVFGVIHWTWPTFSTDMTIGCSIGTALGAGFMNGVRAFEKW